MKFSRPSLRAFTLIELLIVIAIMAILTVAFLPTLRGGQAAARNAARKAAVNDIAVALEAIVSGNTTQALLDQAPDTGVDLARIPATTNGAGEGMCIDFVNAPVGNPNVGEAVKRVLGRVPRVEPAGVGLCAGGYWYKSFPVDAPSPTNYIIVTEVEGGGGNVPGASFEPGDAAGDIITALNAFPNFSAALNAVNPNGANSGIWMATK